MPAVEKSIIINAPPEKIWAMLSNPVDWIRWFEGAAEPKSIQGDGGVGTVVETGMTLAGITLPAKITIVETVPYERWKAEFSGPATDGYQLWTYMQMGPRTKLTFRIEANLGGPAKLAEGLVVKSFEELADKTLHNIKAMVEG